jgi:hypothetical protein
MDNKVFYGEYTLRHWINMILRKELLLPEYQRFFVWKEKKMDLLIETLQEKRFVPPVSIGVYMENEEKQNLIIDGQQRLTSVFLAYLGLFPERSEDFVSSERALADERDDGIDDEDYEDDELLDWTFKKLTVHGRTKEAILSNLKLQNYKRKDYNLPDNFWDTTYLGFSYMVPDLSQEKAQLKYYSKVFRDINIQGQRLQPLESRQALYFLDKDLLDLFSPSFAHDIIIGLKPPKKMDFVRYLSLLSSYKKLNSYYWVARGNGYVKEMERFYENFIFSVVGETPMDIFANMQEMFGQDDWRRRMQLLELRINDLELKKKFVSIVQMDTYLFGLIYYIVFMGRDINISGKQNLMRILENLFESYKESSLHSRSPNALKYMQKRMEESINTYSLYLLP